MIFFVLDSFKLFLYNKCINEDPRVYTDSFINLAGKWPWEMRLDNSLIGLSIFPLLEFLKVKKKM